MSAINCLPETTCNMVLSMSKKPINILPLALKRNQNPHPRVNMISLNIFTLLCKMCVYVPELVFESHKQMVTIVTYDFPFML